MQPARRRNWLFLILMLLGFSMVLSSLSDRGFETVPYSELKEHVRGGEVAEVVISTNHIEALPIESLSDGGQLPWRAVRVPDDPELIELVESQGITLGARAESGCSSGLLLVWLLPMLLLFVFWGFMFRRMGAGGAGAQALSFGKARFQLSMERGTGVTFKDVAGCEEEKRELEEVVDFLKDPERFYRLGARIPKGVLLVGPPGTGKTLLARALAGEADVPFFNLSGSDFVEMFVGVGAARVRDLFDQAQKVAPCIVFIDELDAVGKARGAGGPMAGNDEREQTLNALLVEMDGFAVNSGVILLSATNRPEILDPALMRPGRFDRQILVDRPDIRGRKAILAVHGKRVKLTDDVDLERIAAQTPGFVGADLANIINEAALLAARRRRESVGQKELQDAIERVIAGLEKRNRRMNEREKRIVAFHESGHAIVSAGLKYADPVQKVSIIPRSIGALGYTLQVPLEDRYLMTRQELLDKIGGLLGGRAAEQIIFGDISTGAQNDLQRATDIARSMVTQYGMSESLGAVHLGDDPRRRGLLGGLGMGRDHSDDTAERIDAEVHAIISEQLELALALLRANRDVLDSMSEQLLETEVLEGEALSELLERVRARRQQSEPGENEIAIS